MIKNMKFIVIILLNVVLLSAVIRAEEPTQKAKFVLENFFNKYEKLFSEEIKDTNNIICKMSVKGVSRFEANKSSANAPLLIDTKAELFASNPSKMLINLSGNMGNIIIIISEKKPTSAVILFPDSKQFATIGISERIFGGFKPVNREKFWRESNLTYAGSTNTTQGRAHKVIIKSTRSTEKESIIIHILDRKWDPVRIEYSDPKSGSTTINFDQIQFNAKIPPEKFIPITKGYVQVSKEQLAGIIMMNIMASNMVKKPIK